MLKEIYRFRFLLSRHIKVLGDFSSQRTTDRRLRILEQNGYIERRKIAYGVPSIITLTCKGCSSIGVSKKKTNIKLNQLDHDILVLDILCHFLSTKQIQKNEIISEKEIYSLCGFGVNKHIPDFVIKNKENNIAIEIELSEKAINRLVKNIQSNFIEYDKQVWFVPKASKIEKNIKNIINQYSDIEIYFLEDILYD